MQQMCSEVIVAGARIHGEAPVSHSPSTIIWRVGFLEAGK